MKYEIHTYKLNILQGYENPPNAHQFVERAKYLLNYEGYDLFDIKVVEDVLVIEVAE